MTDNILSHNEMCRREGVSLQRGMNFGLGGNHSVILMSVRPNAPYRDRLEEGGTILVYEGHDHPKDTTCPNPKVVDQPGALHSGKLTQNGRFHQAAQEFKAGRRSPERVRVYEKIKSGIWSYNGIFHLVDSWQESDTHRTVFKFRLVAVEGDEDLGQPVHVDAERRRIIPTAVKPLARMIETEELVKDQDRRRVLAIFIATLFMRTRQGLQTVYGHREEVRTGSAPSEAQLPSSYTKDLLGLDDEGMRELFAKAVVATAAEPSSILDSMHWRLLRATEDYLITSENPLVIYRDSEERWGLGTPGAHIHLPLSPRLVLHVSKDRIIPGAGTFDLPTAGVRGLNGLTVFSAEQYLFSHTDFDQVRDLLQDRAPETRREFGPPRPVPSDNEGT